jgi:stage V sporulation protein S
VEVLKVSSKSNPNSCAGALAGVLRQHGAVEVQVVGAGALNQAIKAVAIARGFVADTGLDVICVPTFADIEIDGESRTAIRLLVEDRERRRPGAIASVVHGSGRIELDLDAAAALTATDGAAAVPARDGAAPAPVTGLADGVVPPAPDNDRTSATA